MAEQTTETNSSAENSTNAVENNASAENSTPTIEELMTQLATERATNERNKVALDKALKEQGELKKSLRARQTAEEQEAEAKKEQEEQQKSYIAELETFKRTAEARSRYALQGMSAELADKAAEAEIAGDMDALADIQKQHTEMLIKQNRAEWLKSSPEPQAGNAYSSMTKEQILQIQDRNERRKAIAQNLNLF